jgi:hypothetical protein
MCDVDRSAALKLLTYICLSVAECAYMAKVGNYGGLGEHLNWFEGEGSAYMDPLNLSTERGQGGGVEGKDKKERRGWGASLRKLKRYRENGITGEGW